MRPQCLVKLSMQRAEGHLAIQSIANTTRDREFKVSVLIVDDQDVARESAYLLCKENFVHLSDEEVNILKCSNITEALQLVSSQQFHVILLDRDLGLDSNGNAIDSINFLQEFQSLQPFAEIIILTSNDQPLEIAKAMSLGASNYLLKANSVESMEYKNSVIRNALANAQLKLRQARSERETKTNGVDYVCKSSAMQAHDLKLEALAETNRPVLILGQSGLGKGVSARMLNSYRAKFLSVSSRPFFNINIAGLTDELAQSELFGHEANSFTGSGNKSRAGYFELANGGDLFLDEIGDASLELQKKLLKVVEEREFQRIGGKQTLKTTARIIFATNKDLKTLVEEGKFKPDLYARISTFELEVPTLEERSEDKPEIVAALVSRANKETSARRIDPTAIPSDLMEYLCRPNIPGNIRGIENDIQRLLLYSRKTPSGLVDLKPWKQVLGVQNHLSKQKQSNAELATLEALKMGNTDFIQEGFPGLKEMKQLVERACYLEATKKITNPTERARVLGLDRSALSRMKGKYLS